jgi:uncharacterized protein (UPF0332 family)
VSTRIDALIDRAATEIDAAHLLADADFHEQAASRAYHAAAYAAQAALHAVGEPGSRRAGVVAGFDRRVVGQGGFDPVQGSALRRLLELRDAADDDWLDNPPGVEAPALIAQRFVEAVARWIAEQGPA